ncbi:hypothetical protein [Haloferula sp. A504]|uniref:hypothetical protein n=1 Tax=Haloferula sp. A504 TaxID=3373601 RepID=UPI0031C86942|nr:hypothetical protein [Verrucomicrobiaceae bacterium E54]
MSDPIQFTTKLKGGSDVARLLNRYPEKVGRTLESLVKQEARGLAVELARNTRSFGFSQKAKKRGEKAVAGDILKVFATPDQAYESAQAADSTHADRFWAHIQNRRFARARKALAESPSKWKHLPVGRLDPKHHQESRTGPYANVTRREPAQIVTSRKALDTYIARIQRRVGFAKGVWIKAAKAIGGRVRGAAQWATRHRKAPGSATVKTGTKPSVTLISRLDYMDDVLTEAGVRLAMEVAAGRLRRKRPKIGPLPRWGVRRQAGGDV